MRTREKPGGNEDSSVMPRTRILVATALLLAAVSAQEFARAGPTFDGKVDNDTDAYGYYAAVTGGKLVNGQTSSSPGKDGVMCFIHDGQDPHPWGSYPGAFQNWKRDATNWFGETAGLALTMKYQGGTVFDNNGIEDGSYPTNFYGNKDAPKENHPGQQVGFAMSNNRDWTYAGYFKLESDTQVDEIVGYFPETYWEPIKLESGIEFNMNIYSTVDGTGDDAGYKMPTNTGAFRGDVLSDDTTPGTFSTGDTGEKRYFWGFPGDDDIIYRLTYGLDEPITLPAGEYFFSHDAQVPPIPEPAWLGLLGAAAIGASRRRRR
ncbi:MAG: PEP-CTERM sorting domain-containing protein [Planctomycetota bacterium]